MEQESEKPQPPKRPIGIAFVLAMAGLLLLDGAVHLFVRGQSTGRGCMLLGASLALLVLSVLWGAGRI